MSRPTATGHVFDVKLQFDLYTIVTLIIYEQLTPVHEAV